MEPVRLTIVADPQPQGSAKIMPIRKRFPLTLHSVRDLMLSVVITSDNAALKAWRKLAAAAARDAYPYPPHDGPVAVEAVFYLAPPNKIPANRGGFPIARGCGDLDKYLRALGDAMAGIVYVDDVQIVKWTSAKHYADLPRQARVDVTVTPIAISLPFPERTTVHAHRDTRAARAAAPSAVPW